MPDILDWLKLLVPALLGSLGGAGAACLTIWVQRPGAIASAHKTAAEADALQVKTAVELWEHLSALQAQISTLRADLAKLNTENSVLRAENAQLVAKNAALETRVAAQDAEIASLKQRLTDYEGRFTQAARAMAEGGRPPLEEKA